MAIFDVHLEEPGMPQSSLEAGVEGVIELATICVGPQNIPFQLPLKHAVAIPYFARAFDGSFAESRTNKIGMKDEDPEAFKIFITWMYRGILHPDRIRATIPTWTRLMLMADKMCIRPLADGVAQHIANRITYYNFVNTGESEDWGPICEGYLIASEHKYRYVFLNAIYDIAEFSSLTDVLKIMEGESVFFKDYLSWSHLVRRSDGEQISTQRYAHGNLEPGFESMAHDGTTESRSVSGFALSAVLFPGEEFPNLFHEWTEGQPKSDEGAWAQLRAFLRI